MKARCLIAAVLAIVSLPTVALGVEAKCLTPPTGGTCVCNEPFLATSYPAATADYYNPNDSTTFQCTQDGVTGAAVSSGSGRPAPVASTDATALSGLPSGSAVVRFMTNGANGTSSQIGHNGGVSGSAVRIAARWYTYHSPGYIMKGDTDLGGSGNCNSKWSEHHPPGPGGVDNRVDYTGGFHTYNFLNWSPAVDCCVSGPGPDSMSSPQMRGKWIYSEIAIGPMAGPNTIINMWLRNITDDGPELHIIDTSIDSRVNHNTPPARIIGIYANNFRVDNGGSPCSGFDGFSHYILMTWPTNAGQRIGAAAEVEGGTGPSNTSRASLQGAVAMGASTPGRVIGTVLSPRPAIRAALASALVVLLIVAYHATNRRTRR